MTDREETGLLRPSLNIRVFFHHTCILLDDFQRDIATIVVLKRSPRKRDRSSGGGMQYYAL